MFLRVFLMGVILQWSFVHLDGYTTNCTSPIPLLTLFSDCSWCYGYWGCFQIGGPFLTFSRLPVIFVPPQAPDKINCTMQLFTRDNPITPFIFAPNNINEIANSNFDKDEESKFLIGGFLQGDFKRHLNQFVEALLLKGNYNVFLVNWKSGSNFPYEQATANTRMVGVMLAKFIQLLNANTGHQLSKIHIIGHSLGSHIAGYAGEKIEGLRRITGLDPAGLYFEHVDPVVRLSTTDADFVDIIHTNAGILLNFGINQNIGHVDFWPNGGSVQLGCSPLEVIKPPVDPSLVNPLVCNHAISVSYFIASINAMANCTYQARQCTDYQTYEKGLSCNNCGSDGSKCAFMGVNAEKYKADGYTIPASQPFYLNTNPKTPFCIN